MTVTQASTVYPAAHWSGYWYRPRAPREDAFRQMHFGVWWLPSIPVATRNYDDNPGQS